VKSLMLSRERIMNLFDVTKIIPAPTISDDPETMARLREELTRCGYDIANCARRLDVFPRLGVSFWPEMRIGWTPKAEDPVSTLITLFIDGRSVSADEVAKQISTFFVDAAIEMGILELNGGELTSDFCLFPCYGKYLITDKAAKNTAINQVMWLWGESYLLGGLVKRTPRRRAVDLGTGSGIHAILASVHCASVVASDVNPRAIAFSKFNAALNATSNVDFVISDLLASIDGDFDLLTANPPYAPDAAAKAGDNFWSGGSNGTELLSRIVHFLPSRLDPDGVAHIVSLYPNPPGTTISQHFDIWLDGKLNEWDVIDHTWRVPTYKDLFSAAPYEGDKSAWRFGVVSLRRSASGNGWWKEVAGRTLFFGSDGACRVVADHDAI
jgi:SAM-dependent methyltransferase